MRKPRIGIRTAIAIGCPLLVAVIGDGDFRQGDENSMLLFYMIPIALATWYSGSAAGLIMVALSVAAAVTFYSAHGIQIQHLLTDRGSTYRSKLFAASCHPTRSQAPLHQALSAPDQRQGRALHPDHHSRVGLCSPL